MRRASRWPFSMSSSCVEIITDDAYSVLPCLFKCLVEVVVVGIFALLILKVYNLTCIQLL